MAPMIAYTLPAMQLVCNLVIPGAPGPNISNFDSKPGPVQSENMTVYKTTNLAGLPLDVTPTPDPVVTESSSTIEVKILPDGYTSFPELGAAFKYHRDEELTWRGAVNKCIEEGGNLVVTDSWRKFDVVQSLLSPRDWIYVGIKKDDSGNWVDVRTGSPVPDIPWKAGEPYGAYFCAVIRQTIRGLRNYACHVSRHFVCEIKI